ncbi:acetyl-coenzyme A synthetase 2-like, mitochondrial isoform X2 [Rhincodon typus]|uniref:acetyl-coenzyme A synthetase 2-like, mitochondrial isoform X2 n=1 Tax=Rhincodon typus TaxID=259920 RepID=UPI00202F68B4|nr:acetyl-coenzyme A synthetase 2-like, mitochondrial isoform X2 [Rhincodon typus]
MAAIVGGSRLLRIPFRRCPLPSACVNKRTAVRARGCAQGLDPNKIRTFHATSPAPNISSFLPESSSFSGVKSYADLLDFAIKDPETFWGTLAKKRLLWNRLFQRVHDCDFSKGSIAWFRGGQLNVSVNCLDRHVNQYPDRVALIWERDEPGTEIRVTYRELLETTCRLANTLKRHGVQKGDRVAIYLPVSPIGIAAMLACARIGAVHTVVFAGFSSRALSERISDAQCKAVITCNQGVRGGRVIELKKVVDEAVKSCPTVKCIFVAQRTDSKVPMSNIDIPLEEEMEKEEPVCEPESMDSEDILFLLYTSGSTGKPKGLVHTQAGYLLYTSITHKYVFDYQKGDIFGCMADIGWITGHSYVVYGPLCNGGTTVLFESTPIYPNPETGGVCISPRPSEEGAKILPSMAMRPFFGIQLAIMDEKGNQMEGDDVTGALCITKPWPGIARSIYGDHPRFLNSYFKKYPGYYLTGDGAHRSEEGYYKITGRLDDIINISGHRLGTAEIEDALAEHPDVPETAVIGYPHDMKGEAAFAFVVLKDTCSISELIIKDLKTNVASKIAKYAIPDHILVVKRLPKTRSGKIMRRVLKKIATDDTSNLGDLSTLDDPQIISEIIAAYKKYKNDHMTRK